MKTLLVITLALLPVVVIADLEAMLHLPHWYLVWLGYPLIGVVLIVVGKIQKRAKISPFGVSLILAGVIGGVAAWQINLAKVHSSTELGDRVCAALEEHKATAGMYPESLAELVPTHLGEAPVPTLGVFSSVPFIYTQLEDGRRFELGCFVNTGMFVRRNHDPSSEWRAVVFP